MGRGSYGGSGSGPRDVMGGQGSGSMRGGAGPKGPESSVAGQAWYRGAGGATPRDPINGPRGSMSTSSSLLPEPQTSWSSSSRPVGASFGDLDRPYGCSSSTSLGDYRESQSQYLDRVDDWQRPQSSWPQGDSLSGPDPLGEQLYGRMPDTGRTSSLIEDRRYQPQSYSLDPYNRDPLTRDYDLPLRDYY